MARGLARWDPFAEVGELRQRLDQLFEGGDSERRWAPRIDVVQEEDRIVVRADVPGVKPDDIDVEVSDDVLTISGEHEESTEEKEKRYVRRERRYGSFSRSIALPRGVAVEEIDASSEDGVLEVSIPLPKEPGKQTVRITPKAKAE